MKKQLFATLALAVMASSAVKAEVQATSPLNNYNPQPVDRYTVQDIWSNQLTSWTDGSVCQDRAHVWSYMMKKDYNVDSMKIFIHYKPEFNELINLTRKYTGEGKGIWQYHVAPAVVGEDGEAIVLDKMVTRPRQPKSAASWVGYAEAKIDRILNTPSLLKIVKSKITKLKGKKSKRAEGIRLEKMVNNAIAAGGLKCKPVEHIIDHDTDYSVMCHYQFASMYYTSPQDLRLLNYNARARTWYGKSYVYQMADRENYTQELATKGGKYNQYTQFNDYVRKAFDDAFNIDKKDLEEMGIEEIKGYAH